MLYITLFEDKTVTNFKHGAVNWTYSLKTQTGKPFAPTYKKDP